MGVVSNKINIMELMQSGGGVDPTIPGRVSELELETAGLIEANAKIMSSVAALDLESVALAEGLQRVMTSVSTMMPAVNSSVKYNIIEAKNTPEHAYTNLELAKMLYNNMKSFYDNLPVGTKVFISRLSVGWSYIGLGSIRVVGTNSFPANIIGYRGSADSSTEGNLNKLTLKTTMTADDEISKKVTFATGAWTDGLKYLNTTGSNNYYAVIETWN